MSYHQHFGMQSQSTPKPPIIVDLPLSLLGADDEKPSLPSLETQFLHCSKEFSTCQPLRENMWMYCEKKGDAQAR